MKSQALALLLIAGTLSFGGCSTATKEEIGTATGAILGGALGYGLGKGHKDKGMAAKLIRCQALGNNNSEVGLGPPTTTRWPGVWEEKKCEFVLAGLRRQPCAPPGQAPASREAPEPTGFSENNPITGCDQRTQVTQHIYGGICQKTS